MSAPRKSESPGANGADAANKSTDAAIIAPAQKTGNVEKEFATLRAEFALKGRCLHRDGATGYVAERWGLVRFLPTLTDALHFLAQIGGRHA